MPLNHRVRIGIGRLWYKTGAMLARLKPATLLRSVTASGSFSSKSRWVMVGYTLLDTSSCESILQGLFWMIKNTKVQRLPKRRARRDELYAGTPRCDSIPFFVVSSVLMNSLYMLPEVTFRAPPNQQEFAVRADWWLRSRRGVGNSQECKSNM